MPSYLTGQNVRLEPLAEHHIAGLEKTFSPDLTQYFSRPFATAQDYYTQVIQKSVFGPCSIFAIVAVRSGDLIGCSGYFSEDRSNRKIEIGGSWIGKDFQNSVFNVESKLLLLTEAFEQRKYLRVGLKTDSLNIKSQKAMEKLGLVKEGTLRNHALPPNGHRRHSIFYSVIEEEWAETKKKILARLAEKAKRISG